MCARFLLLATALTVASGAAHATEGVALGGNVESLLAFARERHPEFAALRFEADAARARVEPAGALPDPMFGVELRDFATDESGPNLLPGRVGSTRYAVTQTLPWFGKRALRREIAAAGVGEAAARSATLWVDLAWQIKQTHAQHHMNLASLRFGSENLQSLEQIEQIAQLRYANGLAPQQDVLRAQTERTALAGELAMLAGESEQTAARMRGLLGVPADHPLLPPESLRRLPPPAQLDEPALEARLLERNPRLAEDAARIDGAQGSRALTYRNRYPDVNVGLAAIQMRNRVTGWDLMLEINIPLQQDSRRAQEREAERMLDAAQARRVATLNQLRAETLASLAALRAAQRVEALTAGSLLPQAELTLQAALVGYETGRVDFAAVLDAQRQIRRAKEDLVRARVQQELRRADIERAIGEEL